MAAYAGMPRKVLGAYKDYIERLKLHNCLAGGVGTPHARRCGIPQGCPFSMMHVALIIRPWIIIMRTLGAACFILADDVLILAKGERMVAILARAINFTHKRLQSMGARIAPSKSCNFASTPGPTTWLKESWWNEISDSIEVVKDFRYLGAHLSIKGNPEAQR